MHTHIGLWIDHRKAVIVTQSATGEDIKVIMSNAERHPGRNDSEHAGSPYEAQQVQPDDVQQRRFDNRLRHFYDEVTECFPEARVVCIIGPGEAKGELQKHIATALPHAQVTTEPADKLTDRQVAAHMRDHFSKDSPVIVRSH